MLRTSAPWPIKVGPEPARDTRMTPAPAGPPKHRPLTALAASFGLGVLVAWATTATSDEGNAAQPPALVLISTSTLDLSRLVPAQFGDWEPASLQPAQ
jgi:hypothetical protein